MGGGLSRLSEAIAERQFKKMAFPSPSVDTIESLSFSMNVRLVAKLGQKWKAEIGFFAN